MANSVIQTNSLITLNIDANAAATGNAAALSQSPLLGGRRVKWRTGGATGVKLQFAPRIDPATGQAPVAGSALWTDATLVPAGPANVPPAVVTLPAGALNGEVFTDYWVRAVAAGTGAAGSQVVLEGIQ